MLTYYTPMHFFNLPVVVMCRAQKRLITDPLFSGCTNWPRLEKGKGKKRAAGVPAASVATAVDLGGKEGGAPPARLSYRSLLEEALYATDALAGDPERTRNLICFCA